MHNSLLTSLVILSFFCSCNPSNRCEAVEYEYPEFQHMHDVVATVISDPLLLPAMIYDMEVAKDYLLVLCLYDGKWLHIFDKKSGEHIKSTILRGRGPNEILFCIDFSFDKDRNNVSLFDKETKNLLTVNLDSLISGVAKPTVLTSEHFAKAQGVYPLNKEILVYQPFVLSKTEDSSRYFKLSENQRGGHYERYPVDRKLAFPLYVDYRLSISPDQTKMAVGTLVGAILECFDISDGIDYISRSYFSKPSLDESDERLDYEGSGLGFVDLYGTNTYLYASFGGKNTFEYNDIAIFDWEGNPLVLHHTDYNLLKVCVEPDNSILYAIAEDPEEGYIFVSFPLHSH